MRLRTADHGRWLSASRVADQRGLTLIEILIAVVIFSIALLTLGYVLTNNFRGVNQDGRIGVANQVAVAVIESWRVELAGDTASPRGFDSGDSGSRVVTVDGFDYTANYDLVPMTVDSLGNRSPTAGQPDVFELSVRIQVPESTERTYTTVIARAPDVAPVEEGETEESP